MVNVVHDVTGELRDPHGKWTVGSGGIRAAARAARLGGAGGSGGTKSHDEILGHVRNLPKGSGRRINGHHIDRTQGDKYRVGFRKAGGGRDTKLYGSPEDAAKAIHTGEHHEGGGAAATAGGARQGAQKQTAPKAPAAGPSRYTIVLTGKPNKDKTHYGVKDKQTGTNIISGVDQKTAMETAMDRNASVPKGDERPYADTPDQQLRDMIARGDNEAAARELTGRIVAEQKARTEAENKARFPGGSVTRNTQAGVGVGKPDLAGGATPPKTPDIASLNNQWQSARSRWQAARLPSESKAAQKEMHDAESRLKAAGATFDPRTGWQKPGHQNSYLKKAGKR